MSDEKSAGGITTFNIHYGFAEALVRGYRSGFLTEADYHRIVQCETLEDIKLNLQETDYGQFLGNEATVTPALVEEKATEKLVNEFKFLRANSTGVLAQFLDYITYEYMIENVMLLLKGTLSGRSVNELMEQCHPLGFFKESTMRNIPSFDSTRGYADLYETVLVDTPIGPYFSRYLEESSERLTNVSEMRNILEEVQIEILKSSLMKLYLEDFYEFCINVGGETAVLMGELLQARADRYAINITLNSFGTPLNEPNMRETDRKRLYPSIGFLYPAGTELLSKASDELRLGEALQSFPMYHAIWSKFTANMEGGMGAVDPSTFDDEFFKKDARMHELAFEGQMHFAMFYGYVKLKEQEIRNLIWICECILQRRKDQINKYIPVFNKNRNGTPGHH